MIGWEDEEMKTIIMELTQSDHAWEKRFVKSSTQVSEDIKQILASNLSEDSRESPEEIAENRHTAIGLIKMNGVSDIQSVDESEPGNVDPSYPSSSVKGA